MDRNLTASIEGALTNLRRSLAHILHATQAGPPRSHARADRLAEAVARGNVRLRRVSWSWRPNAQRFDVLKQQLERLGSPRTAEGSEHAQLRLAARAVGGALQEVGDEIVWEATTERDQRLDLLLLDASGQARLGIECGAVAADNVLDHLGVGVPHVIVFPFIREGDAANDLNGWLFSHQTSSELAMPDVDRIRAVYASLEFIRAPPAYPVMSQRQQA